ncbi:MAG: hypothetical protein LQ337_006861 [Flavoplaca oasis]|nr:MAG: hypothetical protein LQ337_006861 [Flavoplaca oasis]
MPVKGKGKPVAPTRYKINCILWIIEERIQIAEDGTEKQLGRIPEIKASSEINIPNRTIDGLQGFIDNIVLGEVSRWKDSIEQGKWGNPEEQDRWIGSTVLGKKLGPARIEGINHARTVADILERVEFNGKYYTMHIVIQRTIDDTPSPSVGVKKEPSPEPPRFTQDKDSSKPHIKAEPGSAQDKPRPSRKEPSGPRIKAEPGPVQDKPRTIRKEPSGPRIKAEPGPIRGNKASTATSKRPRPPSSDESLVNPSPFTMRSRYNATPIDGTATEATSMTGTTIPSPSSMASSLSYPLTDSSLPDLDEVTQGLRQQLRGNRRIQNESTEAEFAEGPQYQTPAPQDQEATEGFVRRSNRQRKPPGGN